MTRPQSFPYFSLLINTVEVLLATSSSYDHLYENPFKLTKLCNEKLSKATATTFGITRISEVVAYESFDCNNKGSAAWKIPSSSFADTP